MAETKDKKTEVPPVNFLCDEGKVPEKKSDEFYDFEKLMKLDYG